MAFLSPKVSKVGTQGIKNLMSFITISKRESVVLTHFIIKYKCRNQLDLEFS